MYPLPLYPLSPNKIDILLNHISNHLSDFFKHWLYTNSSSSISTKLCKPSPTTFRGLSAESTPLGLYDAEFNLIAIFDATYLNIMQESIFKDIHTVYDAMTYQLWLDALSNLFNLENLSMKKVDALPHWHYPHSPTNSISVYFERDAFNIDIHPYFCKLWVTETYPYNMSSESSAITTSVPEYPNPITLNIELDTFKLPLSQIKNLKVGAIIKTDHAISQPLWLTHPNIDAIPVKLGNKSTSPNQTFIQIGDIK